MNKFRLEAALKMIIILICFFVYSESYCQITNLDISVSRDSSQNSNSYSVIYPRVGMGTGDVFGNDDWTYNDVKIPAYIVLNGNQPLFAARFDLAFDSSKINLQIEKGDLFTLSMLEIRSNSNSNITVNISSLSGNAMPMAGKSLVKLYISVLKPGISALQINNPELKFYDAKNDVQFNIPVSVYSGTVKFYLGDFATARTVQWTGDGNVNYQDVCVFGQHYGSLKGSSPLYKTKFDLYPTKNFIDYYSMPEGDGSIDFYDLILFAIGYNYEASGNLLFKTSKDTTMKKIYFSLKDIAIKESNKIIVPLYVDGEVKDLRGYSLKLLLNDVNFDTIEFQNRCNVNSDNIFTHIQRDGQTLTLDVAVLGASNSINNSGELGEIIFKFERNKNKPEFALISAVAMDSFVGPFLTYIRNN